MVTFSVDFSYAGKWWQEGLGLPVTPERIALVESARKTKGVQAPYKPYTRCSIYSCFSGVLKPSEPGKPYPQ